MRVRRIRLDLFISFLLALAIYGGILFIGEKLHVVEIVGNVISKAVSYTHLTLPTMAVV